MKLAKYIWGLQVLGIALNFTSLGPVAGTVIIALVDGLYFTYLFMLHLTRKRKLRHMGFPRADRSFGAASILGAFLLTWCCASLLWAPVPATAAPYCGEYVIQVLTAYLLCRLYRVQDVLRNVCEGTMYAATVLIPLSALLTGFSLDSRLGSLSDTFAVSMISNQACLGLLGLSYLVLGGCLSKKRAILPALFLFAGLYFTFAKTEIIALAVAAAAYVLVIPGSWRQRWTRIFWMLFGTAVSLALLSTKIAAYRSLASSGTLSGRMILWAETLIQISSGPFLRGFGVFAFREIGPVPFHDLSRVVHAHNEFLTIWFNFGLVGIALVFSMYFVLGAKSLRATFRKAEPESALAFCAVVFTLVLGLASANGVLTVLPIPWILVLDSAVRRHGTDRVQAEGSGGARNRRKTVQAVELRLGGATAGSPGAKACESF